VSERTWLGSNVLAGPFTVWRSGGYKQERAGRISTYWRQLIQEDPMMRNIVMVIDLRFGGDLGGKRLRVATVPLTSVSGTTGLDHSAIAALVEQPSLEQVYALNEATSSARSITISLSTEFIDPAQMILNGLPLFGFAEVSLEPARRLDGSNADYDERYVLMRGDIGGSGGPRFGALRTTSQGTRQAEIMELQISDPRDSVNAKFPPWVIDTTRFVNLIESSQGLRIPIALNAYNNIPGVRVTTAPSGADTIWVFAYGHEWDVNTSSGVSVNGVVKTNVDATYGWTLTKTNDLKGVPVSQINFTNAATVWEDTDVVHISTTASGDTYNTIKSIERLLVNHSPFGAIGLDASLFTTAEADMGQGFSPDILINEAGSGQNAMEWVEDTYLESFPMISMIWSNGKYGPIVTDFRLSPKAKWEVGTFPLFDRMSLVEETPKSEIENEFVIRYDYDPLLDIYRKVLVRGAETSDVCAYSQAVAGPRHRDPIQSKYIKDEALARYVLDWMVAHRALPSYFVMCEGASVIAFRNRVGDTISLTSDEYGWVDQAATIESMTIERARCVVGLRVWVRYIDLGGGALSYT